MTIMDPRQLHSRKPFQGLFPIREDTLNAVVEHMRVHGFDPSYPIVYTWLDDEIAVVDGHTRLRAARMLNLDAVPVILKTFSSEEEALQYAIHNQRDRRNMTDGDLLRCIEAVDKLKKRGGDRKSEKSKALSEAVDQGKSAEETARIVGTSRAKVEKARAVLRKATSDTKQAVKENKKSINQAYRETAKEQEPKYTPTGYEASFAFQFASMAKSQMERIDEDDPYREEALGKIQEWLWKHRNQSWLGEQSKNPKSKAILDKPLVEMLVSVYNRITELKRANWERCPKDTIKERLQMLLRLVEE